MVFDLFLERYAVRPEKRGYNPGPENIKGENIKGALIHEASSMPPRNKNSLKET
jgi:hypothetical protein